MIDPTPPGIPPSPASDDLRQLIHDLRTPLSVIAMGLEILKQVRNDDENFNRIVAMIADEGVEPMKRMLAGMSGRSDRGASHSK